MKFSDKELHIGLQNSKWLIVSKRETAIADEIAEAQASLHRSLRARHSCPRQEGSEDTIAGGIGGGAAFPHRQIAAARCPECKIGRDSERDCVNGLCFVQRQEIRGSRSGRDRGVEG